MLGKDPKDLFDAYVDGDLHPDATAAFERALSENEGLRSEFDGYQQVVQLVRHLPTAQPPSHFLLLVQNRIRRRTRGRYFQPEPRPLVVEVAVCAVLVCITAALYLFGTSPHPPPQTTDALEMDRATLAPADRRFLEEYGSIQSVTTAVNGSELNIHLELATDGESAFRRVLEMHPRLSGHRSPSASANEPTLWVIRAPAGPLRPQREQGTSGKGPPPP